MDDLVVERSVAGAAFSVAERAEGAAAQDAPVATDALTSACAAGLAAMSAALRAADSVAAANEALAGITGGANVQDLTSADEEHATQLGTAPDGITI